MAKKELGQYSYFDQMGEINPVTTLEQGVGIGGLNKFLDSRKLWNEKGRGNGILIQFGDNTEFKEFNPGNMEIVGSFKELSAYKPKRHYSSTVAVFESNIHNPAEYQQELSQTIPHMRKGSPYYIFEEKSGHEIDRDNSIALLSDLGLVRKQVYTGLLADYYALEGRFETIRKKPKHDLTSKSNLNLYKKTREKWGEMVKSYVDGGFRVVNSEQSKILGKLKASSYILDTWGRLENGWGVEIQGMYCDCEYEIDLKGSVKQNRACGRNHDIALNRGKK